MGHLYDLATKVNEHLEQRNAGDPIALLRAKGEVAKRVGFLVSLIGRSDPDDPVKIGALRRVAADLGIQLR